MRQDLRDKEGLTGRIGLEKACEGVDRVSAAKRLGLTEADPLQAAVEKFKEDKKKKGNGGKQS